MPVSASTLRLLMQAGLSGDDLLRVVESIDSDSPEISTRTSRQERNARYYQARKDRLIQSLEGGLNKTTENDLKASERRLNPRVRVEGSSSNLETTGFKKEKERTSFFDDFWKMYPHKVGKRDAEKAWATATRRSPPAEIIAGVGRYVASKPEDRPWCNPATFLNQDRWTDQPAINGSTGPPETRFARSEYVPPSPEEIAADEQSQREAISGVRAQPDVRETLGQKSVFR